MIILKLDYIKSFETDLKGQLAMDKTYQPISKKLAVVLRKLQPFLNEIELSNQKNQEQFVKKTLSIHQTYAKHVEDVQAALKEQIEINHDQSEINQKERIHQSHELNQALRQSLEAFDESVQKINDEASIKLEKADQALKRELSSIHKAMVEARKKYQKVTLEIEKEKEITVFQTKLGYDQKVDDLKENTLQFEAQNQEQIAQIKEQMVFLTKEHDGSYLNIKNTYAQLSISLNKKINDLKKKQSTMLTNLEKGHKKQLMPIEEALNKLKVSYQEALNQSLIDYSEKLTSLNVIFDIQKNDYDTKKEKIIHDGNEAITLLNSKLSAYKETIIRDKIVMSRTIRDQMKSLENDYEKEKKNHELTSELNTIDQELNKQILRTNKDIIEKKRQTQKRLFDHDLNHLHEINDWRLKKALYEYEKKQETAKIDLNYNHNINASERQLKLLEYCYVAQKDIALYRHNQELLPLEYQLQIASSIQERELNMLANDAHLSIATAKHQEALLQIKFLEQQAMIHLEEDKVKALFAADMQVINTNTQLELEKEKIKRDYVLSEQEIRIELNQAIFNKTKLQIDDQLNRELLEIELEKELMKIENHHKLDQIKTNTFIEEQHVQFHVSEAKYKQQLHLSLEKAKRLLNTYQSELEFTQKQTENLMSVLRMLYQRTIEIKGIAIELYHLPSHPEVFKAVLKEFKTYIPKLIETASFILDQFQSWDQNNFNRKIEDLTGYKYMLKHENSMNYYETEFHKIDEKKLLVEKEIKDLEESFFKFQTEIERHHAFVNQLNKISVNMKEKTYKSENRTQELKENQKLVSNHDHEIKRIKQELTRIEKAIDEKHLSKIPFEKEMDRLKKKQLQDNNDLESKKYREASVFYGFLNRNQHIYQQLSTDLNYFFDQMTRFIDGLANQVYLTDTVLELEQKKFEKERLVVLNRLNKHQQSFLNLMLNFYLKNEKDQARLTHELNHSTQSLLNNLRSSFEKTNIRLKYDFHKKLGKLKRDNDHQREKIAKKVELEGISFKKKFSVDQFVIKTLEQKITENNQKVSQELNLINDNQISIANQYQSDYLIKVKQLTDHYQKTKLQIENNDRDQVKSQQSLQASLEAKNQMILVKYQNNHEKHLMGLKQKTMHYDKVIFEHNTNIINQEFHEEQNLKRMNKKREQELRNIRYHVKKFTKNTKRLQNKEQSKEIRLLRKTHRAKVKMLNLN